MELDDDERYKMRVFVLYSFNDDCHVKSDVMVGWKNGSSTRVVSVVERMDERLMVARQN